MTATQAQARSHPGRYLLLAVGIAGLSTAGVLYKLASAPTLAIVAYRTVLAVIMMVPLYVLSRRGTSALQRSSISRNDAALSALAGTLFAIDVTVWAISVQFTTISSAALLVSMDPIFVAVAAAIVFGERPSPAMMGGMALAVAGAAVITIGDFRISGRAFFGDVLALSAAVAETGYLLLGRSVRQRVDTVRYAGIVYIACALCVWIAVVALRVPTVISGHDLLVCAALALFATVLGHTLVSWSLGHMPAAVVAISFLSQPIVTAMFAYIVLHQLVAPLTALGGTIALAGIGVVVFANERAVASGPPQAI